jgi:hypothetical protein
LPFNRFITLAWELGGIAPDRSVGATGDFIKLAREWMNERHYPMPWAGVQERGPKLGAHCHILLHVPLDVAPLFSPMPKRWARKLLGGKYFKGVVDTTKLSLADAPHALPAAYEAEVLGRVHYMLKCAPAALEGPLGMVGRGAQGLGPIMPGLWQARGRLAGLARAFARLPHAGCPPVTHS